MAGSFVAAAEMTNPSPLFAIASLARRPPIAGKSQSRARRVLWPEGLGAANRLI